MDKWITLLARVLLAQVFFLAGIGKLGAGYAATQGYMAAMGVPGFLLPLVIALEIGGGLALALGVKARWVALLLAGFSVASALLFHWEPGNSQQMIQLTKNLAMAGGLLMVFAHGAGKLSWDGRKG
ncbi:DoxX family protein [Chromobacterium haemolyticum]|uniref:DoxX family protein n=1 Tax=Chromobacterium haemolyticum TaxID=394935 RepID=A0ABS3GH94_9NEIS|nr:DoxX family protein [Chromobacterium haemolyticum]MBK0413001.1 DoxX family protein [Chromobacterium haemolyticum]MBO0414103.1 DoxX family protein [Chromobacterium haemolyticum]MBO0497363.1 DoxX family protein [Chromobacterium haemolyticum]OQS34835.1 DoxX family protein [Chromobacterium haemolyticum]QOD82588.1 DoxX family protein [Chromobacterium haemolyticum]